MSLDQGIRYELRAMISFPDVLHTVAAARPPAAVVLLDQGLALIPVTPELAAALQSGGEAPPPESGFRALTPEVYTAVTAGSMTGPLAYVEAEYSGRDGWQAAAVWIDGSLDFGPEYLHPTEPFPPEGAAPITQALRRLGAVRVGRHDEFVSVGLGRHRSTADWQRAADRTPP